MFIRGPDSPALLKHAVRAAVTSVSFSKSHDGKDTRRYEAGRQEPTVQLAKGNGKKMTNDKAESRAHSRLQSPKIHVKMHFFNWTLCLPGS